MSEMYSGPVIGGPLAGRYLSQNSSRVEVAVHDAPVPLFALFDDAVIRESHVVRQNYVHRSIWGVGVWVLSDMPGERVVEVLINAYIAECKRAA